MDGTESRATRTVILGLAAGAQGTVNAPKCGTLTGWELSQVGRIVSNLTRDAAWVLVIAFSLSFMYEVYRATIKAGTSQHDSMRTFVLQTPLYIGAAVVISMLFAGIELAMEVALTFAIVVILVSIFYYNPRIMMERLPTVIDWFEDMLFTGLLFVAAALLIYEVLDRAA